MFVIIFYHTDFKKSIHFHLIFGILGIVRAAACQILVCYFTAHEHLQLPLYQRVSMEILKALNSPYQTAYGWRCLDCRVPELAGIIESSSDFAAVETLAAGLSRIDQLDVRLYKAVLSATNCTEISQALELRNQLDQYILDTEIFSPEDQARSELAAMLPEADAQVVASHLNLYAYGSELMKENNSVQTDYGLLERRDGQSIQTIGQQKQEPQLGGMELG